MASKYFGLIFLVSVFQTSDCEAADWSRCEINSPSGAGMQKRENRSSVGEEYEFRPCQFTSGAIVGLRDLDPRTLVPDTADSPLCRLNIQSNWWYPCDLPVWREDGCGDGTQDSNLVSENKVCSRNCAVLCGFPITVSRAGCEAIGKLGRWKINFAPDGTVYQKRSRPGVEVFLRCKVYADCEEEASDAQKCFTTSCRYERSELCSSDQFRNVTLP